MDLVDLCDAGVCIDPAPHELRLTGCPISYAGLIAQIMSFGTAADDSVLWKRD